MKSVFFFFLALDVSLYVNHPQTADLCVSSSIFDLHFAKAS